MNIHPVSYKTVNYLFLRLYEMIPLRPDVLEVAEDVDVAPRLDLPQHRVKHDVTAGAANSGAEIWKVFRL